MQIKPVKSTKRTVKTYCASRSFPRPRCQLRTEERIPPWTRTTHPDSISFMHSVYLVDNRSRLIIEVLRYRLLTGLCWHTLHPSWYQQSNLKIASSGWGLCFSNLCPFSWHSPQWTSSLVFHIVQVLMPEEDVSKVRFLLQQWGMILARDSSHVPHTCSVDLLSWFEEYNEYQQLYLQIEYCWEHFFNNSFHFFCYSTAFILLEL